MSYVASNDGWYYVDSFSGQPVGPYDVRALQGLLSNQLVTKQTSLWKEGLEEWKKLEDIEELHPVIQVVEEIEAATRKREAGPKDELAIFKAEIEALEKQDEEKGEDKTGEAPPSPEEKEFEDDDGTIFVWDHHLRKYQPKDLGYAPEEMTFVPEEEVIPSLDSVVKAEMKQEDEQDGNNKERKRKASEAGPSQPDHQGEKKGKKGKGQPQEQPLLAPGQVIPFKQNTSIYIAGLPPDVTVKELHDAFSKFGLIREDENLQPRIKIYKDHATGNPKGDALVTYLKEPSVKLAVDLMDGTLLRPNCTKTISVQAAKFEVKDRGPQSQSKPVSKKAKKAVMERQEKRLGWGGYDDKAPHEKVTVIIAPMFGPGEFSNSKDGARELEEEVLAEATKFGPVEKVKVYKDHPDGIVTARFKTIEAAEACREKLGGRFFAGRQLRTWMWDGITNYAEVKVKESAEEEAARLEAFSRQLEEQAH